MVSTGTAAKSTVFAQAPAGSDLLEVPCAQRNGVLEMMAMRRDPFAFGDERLARLGQVSGLNALGVKMVIAAGPRAADEILMNRDKAFANGPAWSYFIGPFFNRGIMLLDFDEHRHHRHILQQAFTPSALKGYMQEMQPMIAERVADLPTGNVKMFEQFKSLTLDVALEVFLG
ncbi:MAG: cytochrome P450, partial [Actinomycetota bacterium]|nr:cytochrome P450 [Actinomycetota bacterium]